MIYHMPGSGAKSAAGFLFSPETRNCGRYRMHYPVPFLLLANSVLPGI